MKVNGLTIRLKQDPKDHSKEKIDSGMVTTEDLAQFIFKYL